MSSTYSDVDGSPDPAAAVRDQDTVDAFPQIQAAKQRVVALLRDARRVLDVGCGPGNDVLAQGSLAVGLDPSWSMVTTAAGRGAVVVNADGHALPVRSASVDGVTADRVLQHVADPQQVLLELVRVLRPGGRLVVCDPDQETLTIHVPGVRPAVTDSLKALRRDVGYRNGHLVATLPARLNALGLRDVAIAAFPLVLTDPDEAFGLPTWPAFWRAEGGFTDGDLVAWDRAIARSRSHGGFVYAVTYFVVSAVTP